FTAAAACARVSSRARQTFGPARQCARSLGAFIGRLPPCCVWPPRRQRGGKAPVPPARSRQPPVRREPIGRRSPWAPWGTASRNKRFDRDVPLRRRSPSAARRTAGCRRRRPVFLQRKAVVPEASG